MARPRVALVEPYWDFWEHTVDFDLRADQAQIAERVRMALDVEWVDVADADAVLVLQTMATPPAWTLARLGTAPVVIWAAHRNGRLRPDLDHGGITSEGATVGVPMLTSILVRVGRPFELVLGELDQPEAQAAAQRALVAAAAATRLGRARIGRVGQPLPGYECVDTDGGTLRAATGIELIAIEPSEIRELYLEVDPILVRELEAETRGIYDVRVNAECLERSLRAACAIEELVRRHRLDAGAMNCHVPEIRTGDTIGIAPCFGLGRSTTAGVPWTCVGDVLTAVAMLAVKLLGGAAQYHELESVDYQTGEWVLASSGEHDLALAPGARPRLVSNEWFAADPCRGACACFSAPAGPATLVAFAQAQRGYRLITADGEFTGREFPNTGTANGAFRFRRRLGAWTDWCRAGANHHSAATSGALGESIEALGRLAGVETVRV